MKKKLCWFLLTIIFIFINIFLIQNINKTNIDDKDEFIYEYFRGIGATEEFLNKAPYEELKILKTEMINSNKIYKFVDIDSINFMGNNSTKDINLNINIFTVRNQPGKKIDEILIINFFEWLGSKPTFHGTDEITIKWDSNIFTMQGDSFSHHTYCTIPGTNKNLMIEEFYNPSKSYQGELSFFVSTIGNNSTGFTKFILVPNTEINNKLISFNLNYIQKYIILNNSERNFNANFIIY